MMTTTTTDTPWQRVFQKFGLTQAALAEKIGKHRSKISRALADDEGLISGKDQKLIIEVAERCGIAINPTDLLP